MEDTIPYLSSEERKLEFGSLSPEWPPLKRTINIGNQNSLSADTYDVLKEIVSEGARKMPVTKEEFIQMWKSLIAEKCRTFSSQGQTDNSKIHNLFLPGPLHDLLNNLGRYNSHGCGIGFEIQLPPENGELWWRFDESVAKKWLELHDYAGSEYRFVKFPNPADREGKSLLLLTAKAGRDGATKHLKSFTNEATTHDALLYAVNDDLFTTTDIVNYSQKRMARTRLNEDITDIRLTPSKIIFTRRIRIENQNTLSRLTYQHLCHVLPKLPRIICEENFVTMWKHLILQRCLDVISAGLRNRGFTTTFYEVPEPLYDLLNALGECYSRIRGIIFRIALPPEGKERWRRCTRKLSEDWNSAMHVLSGKYNLRESPKYRDYKNRSLILTSKRTAPDHSTEIRLFTREPTAADCLICCVNDELFEDNPHISFDKSFLSVNTFDHHAFPYIQDYTITDAADSPTN